MVVRADAPLASLGIAQYFADASDAEGPGATTSQVFKHLSDSAELVPEAFFQRLQYTSIDYIIHAPSHAPVAMPSQT